MNLKREIEVLEQYFSTTRLVRANLFAARERLLSLPEGEVRERLLLLQQQAIDTATVSLDFTEAALQQRRQPPVFARDEFADAWPFPDRVEPSRV